MKEIVKRMQSYLAFDGRLAFETISSTFTLTQNRQQKIIPQWGTESTRQKLISFYWFNQVVGNFLVTLGLGIIFTLIFTHPVNKYGFVAVCIAGIFSFLVMLFFHYLPNFTSDFLPKLDAIRNGYIVRQQEEIIKKQREELSDLREQ